MEEKNMLSIKQYAKELNVISDVADIHKFYISRSQEKRSDIRNIQVTLMTMCVNREIRVILDKKIDADVTEYPNILKEIYASILDKYTELNSDVIKSYKSGVMNEEESVEFEDYLDKMVKLLLSGIKYIEKKKNVSGYIDKKNHLNQQCAREERIRDNMKRYVTSEKKYREYTIRYGIEVPYMYILAWDLPNLWNVIEEGKKFDYSQLLFESEEKAKELEKNSYIHNLHGNIIYYFRYISDSMINILLHGWEWDEYSKNDAKPIFLPEKISYEGLLPTIKYREIKETYRDCSHIKDDKGVYYIKKEALNKIPLLPYCINGKYEPERVLDMLMKFIRKENELKEYNLSQDIMSLSDSIMSICDFLQECIKVNLNDCKFLRIKKDEIEGKDNIEEKINRVKLYLEDVRWNALCLPRNDNEINRQQYIDNIVNSIVKIGDNIPKELINRNDKVQYAYFSALKHARNWNAHLGDNQHYNIRYLVFIFAVAISFILDEHEFSKGKIYHEYEGKEAELFDLVSGDLKEYKEIDEKTIAFEYEELKKAVFNMRKELNNDEQRKSIDKDLGKKGEEEYITPHDLFKAMGDEDSKFAGKMTQADVAASFWLTIHMNSMTELEVVKQDFGDDKFDNLKKLLENAYILQKDSIVYKGNKI